MLDFAELKAKVSIEQVLPLLGITLRQHNAQLRGACPICKSTDHRSLVVTPAKNLWYCFAGCGGGDQLKLVSKMRNCDVKAAAQWIADSTSHNTSHSTSIAPSRGGTVPQKEKQGPNPAPFAPLTYLEASHQALAELGVSPETLATYGAGFAPKGILRGRLAIPIHDRTGVLLAYCGRTVKGESPLLTFPNGFRPDSVIFNGHRIKDGELYLVHDVLDVLKASENGIENVICLLTEGISPQQLEQIAALMDEKKIEILLLF